MLVSESSAPTVLILYSPDCAAHEQVVIELAKTSQRRDRGKARVYARAARKPFGIRRVP